MNHQHYQINLGLSVKGVDEAISSLDVYKKVLSQKANLLCERLADAGIEYAMQEIDRLGSIGWTTGLYNSISKEPGTVTSDGATWIIYTDCPYAVYVEYGTGTMASSEIAHPSGEGLYTNHSWTYFNERVNHFVKTQGFYSRPFWFNTKNFLQMGSVIREIAKEVFK